MAWGRESGVLPAAWTQRCTAPEGRWQGGDSGRGNDKCSRNIPGLGVPARGQGSRGSRWCPNKGSGPTAQKAGVGDGDSLEPESLKQALS